jgi:hypothetical protein
VSDRTVKATYHAPFFDGTRITAGSEKCRCANDCEFPCWQRLGIAEACGACGCPPLPEDEA